MGPTSPDHSYPRPLGDVGLYGPNLVTRYLDGQHGDSPRLFCMIQIAGLIEGAVDMARRLKEQLTLWQQARPRRYT